MIHCSTANAPELKTLLKYYFYDLVINFEPFHNLNHRSKSQNDLKMFLDLVQQRVL